MTATTADNAVGPGCETEMVLCCSAEDAIDTVDPPASRILPWTAA
jgi:hypothetical protein